MRKLWFHSMIFITGCALVSIMLLFIIFNRQRGEFCVEKAKNQDNSAGSKYETAPQIRCLGNPFKPWAAISLDHRYKRNVWDMQLWEDKIYLGYGNSSNKGPAPNAGPVHVIAYHPQSGCFRTEFTVDEEQVDRYRIIGNHLFIPGHDPLEPWDWGNFYYLIDGGWKKNRTIPLAIHTYDILQFKGDLYAALGTTQGGAIARSMDNGKTWENFLLPEVKRVYELFILGGKLYAHGYRQGGLYQFDGDGFNRLQVDLFPSSRHGPNPMLVRSLLFKDVLLYIGADNINDHQWIPFGAYMASEINAAQKLSIPAKDIPYDILVRGRSAYILTNRQKDSGYSVTIFHSTDMENWIENVQFSAPSFARSFEFYDGLFYVGLGTHTASLNEASGDIYQIMIRSQ